MLRIGQIEGTFVAELREELVFKLFVIFSRILLRSHGIKKKTSSIHTKELAIFSMGVKQALKL